MLPPRTFSLKAILNSDADVPFDNGGPFDNDRPFGNYGSFDNDGHFANDSQVIIPVVKGTIPEFAVFERSIKFSPIISPYGNRQCENCGTRKTPYWRREPQTGQQLCNACGLYHRQYGRPRTFQKSKSGKTYAYHLIHLVGLPHDAQLPLLRTCHNCGCNTTPVWRKSPINGCILCNACAHYGKPNGKSRSMEKKVF